MSKTVGANLKTHMASTCTTLATCFRLTLTAGQPVIASVTQANPGSVTTTYNHRLLDSDIVQFVSVVGMTELNGNFYTVSVITSTVFTINAETSAFTAYASGGAARKTYGLTNIDTNINYTDGVLYNADVGYAPSDLRNVGELAIGNFEVEGSFSDEINISEDDIHSGRLDHAEFEIFVVNYESLADGNMILAAGHIGELRTERNAYVADFQSLSNLLAQDTMRTVSPDCPYDLGDAKCARALASVTVTSTVSTVVDNGQFIDTSRTEEDGYFSGGLVTWTTGNNAGLRAEVRAYASGGTFTLFEDTNYALQVGDGYEAVAGCDKSKDTCRDKFDNIVNFGGFPYLPGQSKISSVGNRRGHSS